MHLPFVLLRCPVGQGSSFWRMFPIWMNSEILFLLRSISTVLLSPNAPAKPFLSGTSLSFSMRSFVTQLSRFLNISSVLVALESKICPGANVE